MKIVAMNAVCAKITYKNNSIIIYSNLKGRIYNISDCYENGAKGAVTRFSKSHSQETLSTYVSYVQ